MLFIYTVVIFGNAADHSLAKTITKTLSQFGNTIFSGHGRISISISENNSVPLFFICETDTLQYVDTQNAVIILKENIEGTIADWDNIDLAAIISSDNDSGLIQLANHNINVITCGMSGKDTITISSKSEGVTMISIQRIIHRLDGGIVEPMEIPVRSGNLSTYQILALCALFCVMGMEESFFWIN